MGSGTGTAVVVVGSGFGTVTVPVVANVVVLVVVSSKVVVLISVLVVVAITLVVHPGGRFDPPRPWLSLCSAPANRPMNTEVSSRRSKARTSRILVSVVSGSRRMSSIWEENDLPPLV